MLAHNSPGNRNLPVVIKAHQTTKHIALQNPKQVPLNEGQHDNEAELRAGQNSVNVIGGPWPLLNSCRWRVFALNKALEQLSMVPSNDTKCFGSGLYVRPRSQGVPEIITLQAHQGPIIFWSTTLDLTNKPLGYATNPSPLGGIIDWLTLVTL